MPKHDDHLTGARHTVLKRIHPRNVFEWIKTNKWKLRDFEDWFEANKVRISGETSDSILVSLESYLEAKHGTNRK